jgi:hypothetical protein
VAPQGVIEGFKSTKQGLGTLKTQFDLPLDLHRADVIDTVIQDYKQNPNNAEYKSTYAISVNRLTYEFHEIVPNNNTFGYKYVTDSKSNCEVFSIIDMFNDNTKFTIELEMGKREFTLPKHDYNFFDDKDEHSIRKFMDVVYGNPKVNGYGYYKSEVANIIPSDGQSTDFFRDMTVFTVDIKSVNNQTDNNQTDNNESENNKSEKKSENNKSKKNKLEKNKSDNKKKEEIIPRKN